LYENSTSNDEGTRQVVSECLGKLALNYPNELFVTFQEQIKSTSAFTRGVVLGGLKYAIVEKPNDVDKILQPLVDSFLSCFQDNDLTVRRNTILFFDVLVRYKPLLLKGLVQSHLQSILKETEKKAELVKTIDLGMMKHEVDDGLEIRKSSFELINHLLDAGFELGNISEFVNNQLISALNDTNDLKLLAYFTIMKLSCIPSGGQSLRSGLDKLVEVFSGMVSLMNPPKKEASKKEEAPLVATLPDEIIRGSLSAIASLAYIPGPSHPKFDELLQTVNKGDLKDKYTIALSQEEGRRDLRSSKQ